MAVNGYAAAQDVEDLKTSTSALALAMGTRVGTLENSTEAFQATADEALSTANGFVAAAEAQVAIAGAYAADTTADAAATELDRLATAADRVQTGLDRVQTGLDRAAAASSVEAAMSASNMFASEVLGLAGTPEGGFFSVKPGADGIVKLFEKVAGVAVPAGEFLALVRDHKNRPRVSPKLLGVRGQGLGLRKALSDIRSGAEKSIRQMSIGDSLVGISWSTVNLQLMRVFDGWFASTPVYSHSLGILPYGPDSDSGAASGGPKYNTGTLKEKTDFDAAWDGSLVSLAAGQATTYAIGNNALTCDRIYVPVIKGSAGVVKIEIAQANTPPVLASGSWTNPTAPMIVSGHTLTGAELLVDATGALGCDVVVLDVPFGRWSVKVSHYSGAAVRVRYAMHEVRTKAAYNIWRVGTASNDFTNVSSSAIAVEAAQIAAYKPHLIVVESDDLTAAYQNFLAKLEAAIALAALPIKPLVLLVINPLYDNPPNYNDASIIARAEYCYEFASTRLGWDVVDGMALSGGLDEATAAGWNSDGIHYNGELAHWIAKEWANSRGYLSPFDTAGNLASNESVLSLSRSASFGSKRLLSGGAIPALFLKSTDFDTGICQWAGSPLPAGSGSFTRGNAGDITLATGATAGSGISGYINQSGSLLGINQGNIRGESRGFATRIRTTSTWDANTLAFLVQRNNDTAWNSGYNGPLVNQGWGFRLRFDGTNILIEGVCWLSGALIVSGVSAVLPSGAASSVKDLSVICTPEAINATRGTLSWYAGTVLLGTSNYDHGAVFNAPRVELTNGATAANKNLMYMPFKFMSGSQ